MRALAWLAVLLAAGAGCTQNRADAQGVDAAAIAATSSWSAAEQTQYFQRSGETEQTADAEARCLAFPDLPENRWMPGAAAAACGLLRETIWTVDKLQAELGMPNGAQRLDNAFAALAREQVAHADGGDPLFHAFSKFQADAPSRELAKAWLAASPQSPHAMTALGLVWLESAHEARGARWAHETSPAQISEMHRYLGLAQPLFESALAVEPSYAPACVALIRISRLQGDDELKQRAIAHCDKIDGSSFAVMQARKTAAEPRWGGSPQEIDEVNRLVKQRVATNPALAILLSDGDAESGVALAKDKRWQQAYPLLQQAAARAPEGELLAYAGRTANKLGQHQTAVVYLTQALRFHPRATWYRRWLARTYGDLGQWPQALAQLASAKASAEAVNYDLVLGSDYAHLGWLANKQGNYPAAKQAYVLALDYPKTRQDAAIGLCDIAVRRESDLSEALRCTRQLATEYPDVPMARFMHAWVLTENRQPGAEQAAQAFFALPEGLDKQQPKLAEQLRQLRQQMAPVE